MRCEKCGAEMRRAGRRRLSRYPVIGLRLSLDVPVWSCKSCGHVACDPKTEKALDEAAGFYFRTAYRDPKSLFRLLYSGGNRWLAGTTTPRP